MDKYCRGCKCYLSEKEFNESKELCDYDFRRLYKEVFQGEKLSTVECIKRY